MITDSPSLREDVDQLLERLARIEAQRDAMRIAADAPDASGTLDPMLDTLDHDLTLAARAAARLRERITVGEHD